MSTPNPDEAFACGSASTTSTFLSLIHISDPVPSAIRKAGYGGTNRYEHLMDMANADLVVNTTQKMDMLMKQLYIQSRSFDDVVEMLSLIHI